MIRDQKSNKHIADGQKKLIPAFKREAVQFLGAKNLAVSHLQQVRPFLSFKHELQTANATVRPCHMTFCGLRFSMKNLMLKVSIKSHVYDKRQTSDLR